jgi:glycosyltransferase involved in cell wall biosynthesis
MAFPCKSVAILGIRGIPATHGGFETFAEQLALFLIDRQWDVLVYCQEEGQGPVWEDHWNGIRRVHIPVTGNGSASTIVFDWRSIDLAAKDKDRMTLTLGYNTAVFCARLRLAGIPNVINMDGIEWRRKKWGSLAKAWFWLNDWAGCWLGNHLIADHPAIKRHLETRVSGDKITTISYGSNAITDLDTTALHALGITSTDYAILIARPEPENSILEIVRAWSRTERGIYLLILGNYDYGNPYQYAVLTAASSEVVFLGSIYDKDVVEALRFHARFYIHGHQVGGSNPSLIEALGAGNAVLAHDNQYNRWVAGPAARYFTNEDDCAPALDIMINDSDLLGEMREGSRLRHTEAFTWPKVLNDYESLLQQHICRRCISQKRNGLPGIATPTYPELLGGMDYCQRHESTRS